MDALRLCGGPPSPRLRGEGPGRGMRGGRPTPSPTKSTTWALRAKIVIL